MQKIAYAAVALSLSLSTVGCFVSRQKETVREVPAPTTVIERHSSVETGPASSDVEVHRHTTVDSTSY